MNIKTALAVILISLLSALAAAEVAPRPGDVVGDHVVAEGETLQGITEHYLGVPSLWRENWRLNPDLVNPNVLRPGQTIQVITRRPLEDRTAEVRKVSKKVEKKPNPEDWTEARIGDRLRASDGVRTYRNSSTSLAFDDGSSLVVGEESLVFLTKLEKRLTGVRHETIEIHAGEVDLQTRDLDPSQSSIEIVLGDTKSSPQSDASGNSRSRLRRDDASGKSRVMVFQGTSDVESAGASVKVPGGSGTVVEQGRPPSPPEKLLTAPSPRSPGDGTTWSFADVPFSWQSVARANRYRLKICRDEECELLVRIVQVDGSAWRPDLSLPTGELYWNVSAVAPSGLDGYSSRTLRFQIDSTRVDRDPPQIRVHQLGPVLADQDRTELVTMPQLRIRVRDDLSGIGRVEWRFDEDEWTTWDREMVKIPSTTARFEVRATDNSGKTTFAGFALDRNPKNPDQLRLRSD